MTKEEFIANMIQHAEDYPDTGEIDLASAEFIVGNLSRDGIAPAITPEEFMSLWNQQVHDPSVMCID